MTVSVVPAPHPHRTAEAASEAPVKNWTHVTNGLTSHEVASLAERAGRLHIATRNLAPRSTSYRQGSPPTTSVLCSNTVPVLENAGRLSHVLGWHQLVFRICIWERCCCAGAAAFAEVMLCGWKPLKTVRAAEPGAPSHTRL